MKQQETLPAMAEKPELMRTPPPLPALRQEPTVIEVIRELACDDRVSVDKLAGLMQLQERAEARNAEREFHRDFAAALLEMPRVSKNGTIDMGAKGSMKFARYEDVDKALRPIESKYGFTRSFQTAQSSEAGITMTLVLTHRAGHCERSTRHMPPDTGAGRNGMQAIGSASSYAKRYLTLDMWNIVCEGADDDAKSTGYVSQKQADEIADALAQIGYTTSSNPEGLSKFLSIIPAKTVREIPAACYRMCMVQLQAKARQAK